MQSNIKLILKSIFLICFCLVISYINLLHNNTFEKILNIHSVKLVMSRWHFDASFIYKIALLISSSSVLITFVLMYNFTIVAYKVIGINFNNDNIFVQVVVILLSSSIIGMFISSHILSWISLLSSFIIFVSVLCYYLVTQKIKILSFKIFLSIIMYFVIFIFSNVLISLF